MPFAYFNRLSAPARRVYLASDGIREVALPNAEMLHPLLPLLREALQKDDHRAVSAAADALVLGITRLMRVPEVSVVVLAERPRRRGSELHGLYTVTPGRRPQIKVWMRTAALGKVVAFKTFTRTLLHEVLHHLDYAHYRFSDSFHTAGFYSRESSLLRQLMGDMRKATAADLESPAFRPDPYTDRVASKPRCRAFGLDGPNARTGVHETVSSGDPRQRVRDSGRDGGAPGGACGEDRGRARGAREPRPKGLEREPHQ